MKPRYCWNALSECLKGQLQLGRVFRSDGATHIRCCGTANSYSWRTHTCGELRRENVGQKVCLCGWLQFKRIYGKFVTLRDTYGTTQLLLSSESGELCNQLDKLSLESVLQVSGIVKERPPGQESKSMKTGDIEVWVEQLKILNESKARLPFIPREFQEVNEHLRLQYRYIDIRNPFLQANLRLRSNVTMKIRTFLCGRGFIDVETPTLFRQTPGGAHEFVVPTKHQDLFYTLTQSPQQFKQLLMVGGLDRYFQIARCYRDETARSDRQPEFTQIDIEMSFVTPDGIYFLIEEMLDYCWPSHLPSVSPPFPKMTHTEAINNYGSDKPDTRFEIKLQPVPDFLEDCVPFLKRDSSSDFCTKVIVIPQFASFFAKSIQNKFLEDAEANFNDANLAFIKIDSDFNWTTSLNKYMDENVKIRTKEVYDLHPGDAIIFCFGKHKAVHSLLGKLRLECANYLEINGVNVKDPEAQHFLWITDFPLFEKNEEGAFESMHHPFTAPHPDDVELIYADPSKVRAQHYDLVLNGAEIGGGSIRIHNPDLQKYVISDILKVDMSHLSHLTAALESGCPPHGGIALGLDRLIAIMCKAPSIRDVIAFPKSLDGKDLMANAPAKISDAEKQRYHLK